jgi:multicomponent Na+:H+ antiporter subunit E
MKAWQSISPLALIGMALIWVALTGSLSVPNFMLGALVGLFALFFIRQNRQEKSRLKRGQKTIGLGRRAWRFLALFALFIRELVMSAVRVAKLALKRDPALQPGIFSYETGLTTDLEITLLANLITLTPGTLTVDVSPDRRLLYIHAVDCADIDAARADIRNGFERKIREAFV